MMLIIGLGNPGEEYEGTRHNVGRDAVATFAATQASGVSLQPWKLKRLLHAEVLECDIENQRVLLAKPTTYMNESGRAVAALIQTFTIHHSSLTILHDDLDLPVGTLRLSRGGSSGGHKGVQSVIDAIGTEDFLRLRIGIGPNTTLDGHRIPSEKFVLEKFREEEREKIDAAIARAVEVITILLRDGLAAAQQVAN